MEPKRITSLPRQIITRGRERRRRRRRRRRRGQRRRKLRRKRGRRKTRRERKERSSINSPRASGNRNLVSLKKSLKLEPIRKHILSAMRVRLLNHRCSNQGIHGGCGSPTFRVPATVHMYTECCQLLLLQHPKHLVQKS